MKLIDQVLDNPIVKDNVFMKNNQARLLIVEPNEDIARTLDITLAEYTNKERYRIVPDVYKALWDASDFMPDFVLINYNTVNRQSGKLIRRLKTMITDFQSIIFYSQELVEYENELKDKLSSEPEFNNAVFPAPLIPSIIETFSTPDNLNIFSIIGSSL